MTTTAVTERLALTVVPGAGWSAADIEAVAREAEEAGFDAIFTTEVNNDALATAQLMGAATQRILPSPAARQRHGRALPGLPGVRV
jgi:alkanesulfonate monooxygenase SsuD/methylene tetrahydromethanopterin reductase-like flavin-dependent oxidoreductase (luciferase family)